MRSVALSVIALAASGALAQSDAPKPTFTVRHRLNWINLLRQLTYA